MYRHVFVAAALALATGITTSQLAAQDLTIGAKGGVNVSTLDLTNDDSFEADSKTSFVGGLFAQLGLSDAFAIRGEALFSQKGASAVEDETFDVSVDLNYVEIPALLVFRFANAGIRPQIFAGPVFAFETSCSIEGDAALEGDCEDVPDEPLETNSTDIGVTAGAGLEFGGPVMLLLDGRYTWGLSDILDDGGEEDLKNRAWSFMAGVGIRVG